MKKTLLPLLMLCCSMAFSQGAAALKGTWLTQWDDMLNAMSTTESQRFNSLNSDTKARIKSSFTDRQFKLNDNGQAEITWQATGGERTESGTWSQNGNTLTLVISGQQRDYQYTLSDDTLQLVIQDSPPSAIFSKLILKKQ